jgi:hypothetical protein
MKFNMGCGHNRLDGYVNVDSSPNSAADQIVDLEQTPWPWADGCAEEVLFNHSLEHMGAEAKVFLAIIQDLYRICADGAVVQINAPHPRHDNFIGDPTHVRIVTPKVLSLFDKSKNDHWKARGEANTPFAHYLEVDFRMETAITIVAEPYYSRMQSGELTPQAVHELIQSHNNVASEHRMTLRAHKPYGRL